ncbi:MAG: 30S ribosomal protein S2 [Candidatus Nomurabacteria bacterium]|nr:30S ribosomal protein S2 [Candidatus Nomurabacteria bacterium]
MVEIDIKELLESGAHFGHSAAKWHPKMARNIHSKRGDTHIINLERTVEAFEEALPALTEIAASGKPILFVGTKKQLSEVVKNAAESVEQPYVIDRWVGGTLTNSGTIAKQIQKLTELEKRMESGELARKYNKLEVQRFQEEIDLLNARYGGIKKLAGKPGAVVILSANDDANAVREAKILGVPIFAIVDSNVDPTGIKYAIPGNDDALMALEVYTKYFTEAIKEGLKKKGEKNEKKA